MTTISIEGLSSPGGSETRALAHLKVNYNNNDYAWQIFIPEGKSLNEFFAVATPIIEAQIAEKERLWDELDPKTRTVTNPMTGEVTTVPIAKEEIVKPDLPDYFSMRRNAYPKISDQLDALWKGTNTQDFLNMQMNLYDTKIKFPKGITESDKTNSIKSDVWNKILAKRQRVVEGGAKVPVDGVDKWFNSDIFSRTQWLGMLMLGSNLPPNINWRTLDGTFVTLTPQLVQQVFNAVMTKEIVAFGNGANLYNQVSNSTDPLSVDINVGWPESYSPS